MNVVLTLCSANYLAHAKTLGDSLRKYNPEFQFVIGLVDRWPAGLEASYSHPHEVIPVEELGIPGFEDMARRYKIVELNTAVKPFYMDYLYRRDPKVQHVIYLDPDILVFSSLSPVVEKLEHHPILLTPHSSVIGDAAQHLRVEKCMLQYGLYNLGFIGTARAPTTSSFLHWWQIRLRDHCYADLQKGLFVDQKWMDVAKLFFDDIHIETDPGWNMGWYNLGERSLSMRDGHYVVNGQTPLLFFHFCRYKVNTPHLLTIVENPIPLSDHPELAPLFADYTQRLMSNRHEFLSTLECAFYSRPVSPPAPPRRRSRLRRVAATLVRIQPTAVQRCLLRLAWWIEENATAIVTRPKTD